VRQRSCRLFWLGCFARGRGTVSQGGSSATAVQGATFGPRKATEGGLEMPTAKTNTSYASQSAIRLAMLEMRLSGV
jgi:hypothetical protein